MAEGDCMVRTEEGKRMHIYIFESGEVQCSLNPPSNADLVSMANGILQVLHVASHDVIMEVDEDRESWPLLQATYSKEHKCHVPTE